MTDARIDGGLVLDAQRARMTRPGRILLTGSWTGFEWR
jgi:hypothetical protein